MRVFTIIVTFVISYIPLLLILGLTPYITRKTESFGVSIPENIYRDIGVKKIRDEYRNKVLLFGGLISIVILFIALVVDSNISAILLSVGVFVEIGLMFIFYGIGHKKMKLLKQNSDWKVERSSKVIVDTDFRNKKVRVSPWWFLMHFVTIILTVAIGLIMYDIMPDKVPMNYNMRGEVVKWADKSYKLLFFGPLMQFFTTSLMIFVYWTIGKAKQQIDLAHPERSIVQNRIFRYRWSAFTVFMGFGLVLIFTFTQVAMLGLVRNVWLITALPMAVGLGTVVYAIVLSIKTGQGGSRIAIKHDESEGIINRDEDRYWKWGIFYYNPDDPAIFIEKRFGIGWTNNFARPLSWVMIVGLVAILLLIYYITKILVG